MTAAAKARRPVDILLVDDRPDKLTALRSVLDALGENVVTARSGEEALRLLLQREFAVILLDVNMPGLDGFETAALARQSQRSEKTPIIFVSAQDPASEQLERCYALGAVDFITTPVVPAVVRSKVAVFVDLFRKTEQVKQQAEALSALNAHLQTNVERLTALHQELEAFSYSVSHDLRAPLRHINGFVGLLQDRAAVSLDETSGRYLQTIAGAAAHMAQLIDDLLAFSRMGRNELMRSRVPAGPMVEELIGQLGAQEAGRQVSWTVGRLPEVQGDPAMLRLALGNLLANALKYTRPREQAEIEVGARDDGNGEVVLFVRDNGVGFDMRYADKLFGVFQRLHRAEEFEGTGIGLATVRRIAHRHGGRVWAESRPEAGATFFLALPRPEPER